MSNKNDPDSVCTDCVHGLSIIIRMRNTTKSKESYHRTIDFEIHHIQSTKPILHRYRIEQMINPSYQLICVVLVPWCRGDQCARIYARLSIISCVHSTIVHIRTQFDAQDILQQYVIFYLI